MNGEQPPIGYLPYGYVQNPVNPDMMQQVQFYAAKAEIDQQQKLVELRAKTEAELFEYEGKRQLQLQMLATLEEVKVDTQIKKDYLTGTIVLSDNGMLLQKQDFLLEDEKSYVLCNARLIQPPLKYACVDDSTEILYLRFESQTGTTCSVFLSQNGDANYYRRKFRAAGIIFKKKRNDGKEFFWRLLDFLACNAQKILLPCHRGFYMADGKIHYADGTALLWKDVLYDAE